MMNRDLSYEDLETEAVREREENETFAAQEAEVLLAKEKLEFAQEDKDARIAAFWMHGWLTSLVEDPSATEIERKVAKRALENWYLDNPCMKPKDQLTLEGV